MGYTQTPSWEKGLYVTTKPSPHLVALLEPYRMTPEKWWEKITSREAPSDALVPR